MAVNPSDAKCVFVFEEKQLSMSVVHFLNNEYLSSHVLGTTTKQDQLLFTLLALHTISLIIRKKVELDKSTQGFPI